MAVIFANNALLCEERLNSTMTDGEMSGLQEDISRYSESSADKDLMLRVQKKISQLWHESRMNLGYRLQVMTLENECMELRNNLVQNNLCKNCIDLRKERDEYARKCRGFENRIAEIGGKYDTQEDLLKAIRREVSKLKSLTSALEVYKSSLPEMVVENVSVEILQKEVSVPLQELPKIGPKEPNTVNIEMEPKEVNIVTPSPVDVTGSTSETEMNQEFQGPRSKWNKDPTTGRYKCTHQDCDKSFSGRSHLLAHLRMHSGKGHVCTYDGCGKSFVSSGALKSHFNTHTREITFNCPYEGCDRKFLRPSSLHQHLKLHTGEKKFKCTFEGCGKSFMHKGILGSHVRTHYEKQVPCPVSGCDKLFRGEQELRQHSFVHTGKRKYPCTVEGCESSFSAPSYLKKHLLAHAGERPFKCTFEGCGKTFARMSSLRSHGFTHTADSPYVCSYEDCGQRFTIKRSLDLHNLIHTGEKPHPCTYPGCNWRFRQQCALTTHMKKHRRK